VSEVESAVPEQGRREGKLRKESKALISNQSEMLFPPCLRQAWRDQHDILSSSS